MPQDNNISSPTGSIAGKLGRFARFLVFLVTGGWAFPHVCTEDMDLTGIQKEHMKDAR